MVKDLKRWVGRETTLNVKGQIYHGKIVDEHYFNSERSNGRHYYFKPNNSDRYIPISAKHDKFKNGGLELKLDN